MFTTLTTAVALEACWQIYCSFWISKITRVLDDNDTRGRWFEQFEDNIAEALEAIK